MQPRIKTEQNVCKSSRRRGWAVSSMSRAVASVRAAEARGVC